MLFLRNSLTHIGVVIAQLLLPLIPTCNVGISVPMCDRGLSHYAMLAYGRPDVFRS